MNDKYKGNERHNRIETEARELQLLSHDCGKISLPVKVCPAIAHVV